MKLLFRKSHVLSSIALLIFTLNGGGIFLSTFCTDSKTIQKSLKSPHAKQISKSKAPRPSGIGNQDGAPVGPLNSCDLSAITQQIVQITNIINGCCNQLEQDFEVTFSLVTDLNTSITACSAEIIILDFPSTATVLNDIHTTLTTCCQEISSEFQQTWTILAAGFNDTSTVLFDIESSLTTCCEHAQINFEGTFTLIASIANNQQCPPPSLCAPTQIMAPTTISIPGNYCLSTDIAGQIIINANNVSLDLNNHTISGSGAGSGSGILVNTGLNRLIKNGRVINFDIGIECLGNTDTIIENVIIADCAVEGVTIQTGTAILLDSLTITNITGIGVHFVDGNDANIIKNVTVTQSQQGLVCDFIFNSIIQNCNILDCSSSLPIVFGSTGGIIINNGNFIEIDNCSVKNYIGLQRIAGFSLVNIVENVIVRNCTAQNIVATLPGQFVSFALGFSAGQFSENVEFLGCTALDITADVIAVGFEIEGLGIVIDNCIAQRCNSNNILADGFHSTNNNVSFRSCQAHNCVKSGFHIDSLNNTTVLQFCQSSNNNLSGFLVQSPSTVLDSCVAFNNTIGFALNIAGISTVHCFAAQNGVNYNFFAINVQNANTQVNNADPLLTGPFAGANLFM